jgi:hypothetical protein
MTGKAQNQNRDNAGEKERSKTGAAEKVEYRTETIPATVCVLAPGHSARDTFALLYEKGIYMEPKSFAVGYRVQHWQKEIDDSQYGIQPEEIRKLLGPASYKLTAQTAAGRGVYSFCMCPGGYVVNASSEPGMTAVNGMSYHARDSRVANSAVIVQVSPEDFRDKSPLGGVELQREFERNAYRLAGGAVPLQLLGDFKKSFQSGGSEDCRNENNDRQLQADKSDSAGLGTVALGNALEKEDNLPIRIRGRYAFSDVQSILPRELNAAFLDGMEQFGHKIKDFDGDDVIVAGIESRTSSPVRISRDETGLSSWKGLYPCGEGAGYAGGITSAAMDGLYVAELIAAQYCAAL